MYGAFSSRMRAALRGVAAGRKKIAGAGVEGLCEAVLKERSRGERRLSLASRVPSGACTEAEWNWQELPAGMSRLGSQTVHKPWFCKYGTLFDPEIYETAFRNVGYKTVRRKKMRADIDDFSFDTFSKDRVPHIIQQMRDRSFQFQPVQTESIPQGEGKNLLVGTPSLIDEVIQEALRLILEPAFVKSRAGTSLGCGPQQSARATLQRIRTWTGTTWLIAANVSGYMDRVDHTVLANMIMREVKDQQILDLYWKLVGAGLVNNGNQEPHNLTGASKGGVLWPLFTNIYLSGFDTWLKDLAATLSEPNLDYGISRRNSLRSSSTKNTAKSRNQDMKSLGGGTKVHYIRYADQWVVGVDGPRSVAVKIRDEIGIFLKTNLKLDIEIDNITITHLASEKGKFLGMLIGTRSRKYAESLVGEKAQHAYGRIVLEAPINEIVAKLLERGFALNPEWPRGMSAWIHLEAEEIMRRYRSIMRTLMNYYSIVDNKNMMRRVFWLLRFSAIFTLCRKWRMTTRALFKKLATDPKYEDFIKGRITSSSW